METKRALITGITGQDGKYLADLLLKKGYQVFGLVRRRAGGWIPGIDIDPDVQVLHGDIRDTSVVDNIFDLIYPHEVYHLASQSDVKLSFTHPEETYATNITGTLNMLNALYRHPDSVMYFAASSEMFGQPEQKPQAENYPMKPRSPYAVSKLAGYWSSKVYRESYDLFISCGILYNHESEIRGPNFVTRKITLGIAQYMKDGTPFSLGNIYARKDWGHARDYVEGMWLMLQQGRPTDFVLATNEQHTVQEFLEEAFQVAGIHARLVHYGKDKDRYVDDDRDGKPVVLVDPKLYRPLEADNYQGDYSKAKEILGWEPKITFRELVRDMMLSDLKKYQ